MFTARTYIIVTFDGALQFICIHVSSSKSECAQSYNTTKKQITTDIHAHRAKMA